MLVYYLGIDGYFKATGKANGDLFYHEIGCVFRHLDKGNLRFNSYVCITID